MEYITLFLNNLLPLFLAAGAGYLLARYSSVDARTLSSVAFYIFSPCLVFSLLTRSKLETNELFKILFITLVCVSIIGVITYLLGRTFKLERSMLAAVMITSMFMNAGNYGLPVTLFAFGEQALAYASLFFVGSAVLSHTLGVVVASMGKTHFLKAVGNLFKIPTVYALILALLIINTGWKIPLPIERTTKILADASIPALMVILGIQFHSVRLQKNFLPLALASGMRLLVSPLIILGLTAWICLQGVARQAAVLESAMPAAVLNIVLATQFDTEPAFVTAVVTTTTVLSAFTLPPLMNYLGA